MKPFAIILVVLVIAALAGLGWMFFSSRLDVSFESCAATDPLTQADVFSQLKESHRPSGSLRSPFPISRQT